MHSKTWPTIADCLQTAPSWLASAAVNLTVLVLLSLCWVAKPLLPPLQASSVLAAEEQGKENPGSAERLPQVFGIAAHEPTLVEVQVERCRPS